MHRFFVPPEALQSQPIRLTGPMAHQISHVLRLRPGEEVELLDGSGLAYVSILEAVTGREVMLRIAGSWSPEVETRCRLVLYQGIPKHRRLEWILQKGTELGVSRFVPMVTRYSDVRVDLAEADEKAGRWRRIVTEAAEQSRRVRVPVVEPVMRFSAACEAPSGDVRSFILYEGERERSLGRVLADSDRPAEIRLYVGPEGGFAQDELHLALERGVEPVSLGPRILRAETAALAGIVTALWALGEMERQSVAGVLPSGRTEALGTGEGPIQDRR